MFPEIPGEYKGGAIAGLLFLGMALLRKMGLKASEDLITLKTDAVERDGIDMLQKRLEKMDERIASLEATRNRMYGFIARCMGYLARCTCDSERAKVEKELLENEYLELLKDAAK